MLASLAFDSSSRPACFFFLRVDEEPATDLRSVLGANVFFSVGYLVPLLRKLVLTGEAFLAA